MNATAAAALGIGIGLVLGLHLRHATEGSCCARVRSGVREKLGPFAVVADALGLTKNAPDLLDLFGVPP